MIVGLTGGIGSGKSSVAGIFRTLGITVVDADAVARKVVKPGTEGLKAIRNHFGDQILKDDQLDRAKLRALIFQSKEAKDWLENLLHPIIRQEIQNQLEEAPGPYTILEAPLLFENGLEQNCCRSIVVDTSVEIQIERASDRDKTSVDQIRTIIKSQIPRDERLSKADYIIDNSGDIDDLNAQVLRLDQILRLLAENLEFL